jgi:hypothetical protein
VFDFDRFGDLYRDVSSDPTTGPQNPIPYIAIEKTRRREQGRVLPMLRRCTTLLGIEWR